MSPQEMALGDLIWAILYIVLFFYLQKPITHFFAISHPIRLLYHFVLPILLGLNIGDAISNYILLN